MRFGFIGLGNMGLGIVKHLIEKGHSAVVWNRSEKPRIEAAELGAIVASSIKNLCEHLESPRIIFLMVSAGAAVDEILFNSSDALSKSLSRGDIVIDCANSFYKETQQRSQRLSEMGIHMLDAGISGGIEGARHGASVMVGGDEEIFKSVEPIFKDMSQTDGYAYFGKSGAGHFVKMAHNAIEYGMMQVIAEGMNLLSKSEFEPNTDDILRVWNNGSIIESRLISFLRKALQKKEFDDLEEEIGSLGTGMWASREALEKGVPFTAISHAVFERQASKGETKYAFKIIQAMRSEFGKHTSKT